MLSRIRLSAAPWTVAHQTPLPWEFPGKDTGLQFPSPGIFLTRKSNPCLPVSPALVSRFFTTSSTWETPTYCSKQLIVAAILSLCLNTSYSSQTYSFPTSPADPFQALSSLPPSCLGSFPGPRGHSEAPSWAPSAPLSCPCLPLSSVPTPSSSPLVLSLHPRSSNLTERAC